MVVWEPELIDDGVQEAESSFIVESVHDQLESFSVFEQGFLLVYWIVCDKQHYSTYHVLADSPSSVYKFFALLHFVANLIHQLRILRPH